jgi:phosphatidate cytidylyltransferase
MARRASETAVNGLAARVLSAAVLAPLALAAAYFGSPYFDLMVVVAVLVLAWEWTRICGGGIFGLPGVLLAAVVGVAVLSAAGGIYGWAVGVVALGSLALRLAPAWTHAGRMGGPCPASPAWLAGGALYIGLPSLALMWLRADPLLGRETLFWLFGVVWATDIGAYAAGRLIGGPKLAPAISPKKTWAGLLGGMTAAALVGMATAQTLGGDGAAFLGVVSALLAAWSQAGDLAESWIKRHFNTKDASHLIPGHGGLMDRVDGLLAAAAAVALARVAAGKGVLEWL